jgi:hypothetical protein
MCPVTAHLVGRWGGGVDARGQGAVIGCQDSRPDGFEGLISPGSREFWAD